MGREKEWDEFKFFVSAMETKKKDRRKKPTQPRYCPLIFLANLPTSAIETNLTKVQKLICLFA